MALASILVIGTVTILVCLSLASLSVLNLNVANAFLANAQCENLARAAVNQLISDMDNFQKSANPSPFAKNPNRLDLLARFRDQPVFPAGAADLPGEVSITFDPSQDYYSVDNSESEYPAAGWSDRKTANQSVPPFSVSLVMAVRAGSRTNHYEAVLRRRWPYVLCTAGKLSLMGTPNLMSVGGGAHGQADAVEPTVVRGNVYSLMGRKFSMEPNSDNDVPKKPGSNDTLLVSEDILTTILKFEPSGQAQVSVGGSLDLHYEDSLGSMQAVTVNSKGNKVLGRVDLAANEGFLVDVAPNNELDGTERSNIYSDEMMTKLCDAFQLPDPSGYNVVKPVQVNPDDTAAPTAGAPVAPKIPKGTNFFYLPTDLQFGSAAAVQGQVAFSFPQGNRYLIPGSAGNHYVDMASKKEYASGAGIELDNALLYVQGNLDLSASSGGAGTAPALRGVNSTLIVDGSLVLTDGSLDASDQGMVIYCKRLISQAKGHYRGLMMVQKSAAFFTPQPGDRLHISGGLIVGGEEIVIQGLVSNFDMATGKVTRSISSAGMTGLHLWSTDLEYDPRYLKTLNPLGSLTLLALRQIP